MTGQARTANLRRSINHPCYNGCGGNNTRIHLPVAPSCNIQCNYCLRKYECVNESRPGVTARVLSPQEAGDRFIAVKNRLGRIDVAGIAGPGDALAEFEKTKETFRLVREADPGVTLCLSTNGLLLPRYASEIAALGVSHVTVTVNACDPSTARRIYRFVKYEGKAYSGVPGAEILLRSQYEGIRALRDLGIVIKVNIVMLRGINDGAIPEIVCRAKEAGADIANIMQLIPVQGTVFEHIPMVSNAELAETRKKCEAVLPQMYHCRQCRADAAGTLDEDISHEFSPCPPAEKKASGGAAREDRLSAVSLLFAAASKNGMIIDQHFGHARTFHIYRYENGRVEFVEKRDVGQYCLGKEDCGQNASEHHEDVLRSVLDAVAGCDGVIAMRIGDAPARALAERGIGVFTTYGYVTDAVKEYAERLLQAG